MKLSWKIFFSALVITILTFSIGGYFLITSNFTSALISETNAAIEENKMIRNYFKAVLPTITNNNETTPTILESILSNFANDNLAVRLYDENFDLVADIGANNVTLHLFEQATNDSLIHTITQQDQRYYVQTLSVIHAFEGKIYIEGHRDVSSLYTDRQHQFYIYKRILLFSILFNGILVFFITWWTISPIRSLSKTTREIAKGRYDKRASIRTKDEIGLLAGDFNRMADNLETKIRDLEEANLRQQDFIGSFAHELKTPLTSIIGYADMLRSKKISDENKVLAANYIFGEGKRLESLSFKLLELLVVRNLDFEMKRINMKNLFEDIGMIMEPILKESDIILEILAEDVLLTIEPDLIKTLILNLLDNARKSIPSKGNIQLKGNRLSENRFTITVEDTGKGIPEDDLLRITEAFYMVDKSRARANGGSGLGLALCREIVDLHDGEMEFESSPNIGTTVHLYLTG